MIRFGFVTGLVAEAGLLERAARRAGHAGALIACAGPGTERAHAAAARLARSGAEALVSFGLCGGLDPALAAGTLILAEAIILPDGTALAADAAARARIHARLAAAGLERAEGAILGSDGPVATAGHKRSLFAATRARAVDMESLGVARAAQAAQRPFLVLRALSDPAGRDLPSAALRGLAPDGRRRPLPVLAAVARRPREGAALLGLALESRRGMRALERAAAALFGGD